MPWAARSGLRRRSAIRGPDYVLSLQSNQSQLHEAVAETFAFEQAEGFEICDHNCHETMN